MKTKTFEDGSKRYTLFHKFRHSPNQKTRSSNGSYIFCIDKGDRLQFLCVTYHTSEGKRIFEKKSTSFCLSFKKGRFNLWKIVKNADKTTSIRNISTNPSTLNNLWKSKYSKNERKNPHNDTCSQIESRRSRQIVLRFARRHGIKIDKKERENLRLEHLLMYLCYPALREILPHRHNRPIHLDSSVSGYLRLSSFGQAIEKAFGTKSKKIKKLVYEDLRECSHINFRALYCGVITRGLLSVDNVQTILDERFCHLDPFLPKQRVRQMRKLLSHYNPKKRYTLISGEKRFLKDTIQMYSDNKDKVADILPDNPKNFADIHDHLSKVIRKINNPEVPFEYDKNIGRIHNVSVGQFTIKLPQTNHELIDWSNRMSNCVSSYSSDIKHKRTVILGIFDINDEIIYNVSFNYFKDLQQFYGKYNATPDTNDYKLITNFLHDNDYIFLVDRADCLAATQQPVEML